MAHHLTLSNVDSFSLVQEDASGLFLPEDPGHDNQHDTSASHLIDAAGASILDGDDETRLHSLPADVQAAINATLQNTKVVIDPELAGLDGGEDGEDADDRDGNENGDGNVQTPSFHMAPFDRPTRDENTPHPQDLTFSSKADFNLWLEAECSWCHYVQRRVTNPEKRAEERLKARVKAHDRFLATMPLEESVNVPPLKRRRRTRTSSVLEKVTYTCHHSGSYTPKHSTELPRDRLRMNTKTSVKCNCPSRIVCSEWTTGNCKVTYYWKHEGHDPFAENAFDSGRLPRVVDEWLMEQIEQGVDLTTIRQKLQIGDAERDEYMRRTTEDPTYVDPNLPPPLAFRLRIKYPDIYNRYRKLRGPVKPDRPPRARKDNLKKGVKAYDASGAEDAASTLLAEGSQHPHDHDAITQLAHAGLLDAGNDHQFQGELGIADIDQYASGNQLAESLLQAQGHGHEHGSGAGVDMGVHVDQGHEHENQDEVNLREAVLRMARAVQREGEDGKIGADGWPVLDG